LKLRFLEICRGRQKLAKLAAGRQIGFEVDVAAFADFDNSSPALATPTRSRAFTTVTARAPPPFSLLAQACQAGSVTHS
jgi:hypothetical protein